SRDTELNDELVLARDAAHGRPVAVDDAPEDVVLQFLVPRLESFHDFSMSCLYSQWRCGSRKSRTPSHYGQRTLTFRFRRGTWRYRQPHPGTEATGPHVTARTPAAPAASRDALSRRQPVA